jgi:holo-[acyl-carrier protein] synthase
MILGIGNDAIDIRRIEKAIERYGDRFLGRIFTPVERARSDGKVGRAASYAKRFAAKEACAKALGTGLSRGVYWRDMGVVNLASERITPAGYLAQVHVTLTDDFPVAQAVVIISGVAAGGSGNSA